MNQDAAAPPDNISAEVWRALAALHDLQMVEVAGIPAAGTAVPVWPLAMIAAITVLLAGGLVGYWRWRPGAYRRLVQLRRESAGAAPGAVVVCLAALSALLRDVAVAPRRGAPMPAGLAGEAWLEWLDARAPAADRGAFVGGVGRDLLAWPYASPDAAARVDRARLDELFALTGRWLRANA